MPTEFLSALALVVAAIGCMIASRIITSWHRRRTYRETLDKVVRDYRRPDEEGVAAQIDPDLLYPDDTREPTLLDRIKARFDQIEKETGDRVTPLRIIGIAIVFFAIGTGAATILFRLPQAVAFTAGTAMAALVLRNFVRWAKARHRDHFLDIFPDAIDLIVRAVRAGLPIPEAINTVGREASDPVGSEFRKVANEIQIGMPTDAALWNAANRIRIPDFSYFVVAISLQRETGGNVTITLDNLSRLMRARKEMRLKVRALSSQAKAAMMIIGSLPFLTSGSLVFLSPEYISRLVTDPAGPVILAVASTMFTLGIVTMRAIVRKALS